MLQTVTKWLGDVNVAKQWIARAFVTCRHILIAGWIVGAAVAHISCNKAAIAPVVGPQPQSLPTINLPLGQRTFTLQVADNEARRQTGLMYVRSMPADRGMIFLFPIERVQDFWMHNTPIDLDIVYIDHTSKIVAIKTMHAFDESSVSSDDPADVAIELNAGLAASAGLSVGDKVAVPHELLSKAR